MPSTQERLKQIGSMPHSQALDALLEYRREAETGIAEIQGNIDAIDPAVAPRQAEIYGAGLRRAKITVAEIDTAIAQTRSAMSGEAALARRQPITAGDREMLEQARAFIAELERAQRAAEELAEALRKARTIGEHIASRCGNNRLFMLAYFRERATAGLVQKFEQDPGTAGAWGGDRALLDLGPAKNRGDISRAGLVEYERKGLRDLLPPHIGAAL